MGVARVVPLFCLSSASLVPLSCLPLAPSCLSLAPVLPLSRHHLSPPSCLSLATQWYGGCVAWLWVSLSPLSRLSCMPLLSVCALLAASAPPCQPLSSAHRCVIALTVRSITLVYSSHSFTHSLAHLLTAILMPLPPPAHTRTHFL